MATSQIDRLRPVEWWDEFLRQRSHRTENKQEHAWDEAEEMGKSAKTNSECSPQSKTLLLKFPVWVCVWVRVMPSLSQSVFCSDFTRQTCFLSSAGRETWAAWAAWKSISWINWRNNPLLDLLPSFVIIFFLFNRFKAITPQREPDSVRALSVNVTAKLVLAPVSRSRVWILSHGSSSTLSSLDLPSNIWLTHVPELKK